MTDMHFGMSSHMAMSVVCAHALGHACLECPTRCKKIRGCKRRRSRIRWKTPHHSTFCSARFLQATQHVGHARQVTMRIPLQHDHDMNERYVECPPANGTWLVNVGSTYRPLTCRCWFSRPCMSRDPVIFRPVRCSVRGGPNLCIAAYLAKQHLVNKIGLLAQYV